MKFWLAIIIAIVVGTLEAAWTGPGRGGPVNTWMGVISILVIFAIITRPKAWRIPLLATIEEIVHSYVGYYWWGVGGPTWNTIFNHWSVNYIGFNAYPYILFPLITIIGELAYRKYQSRKEIWDASKPS